MWLTDLIIAQTFQIKWLVGAVCLPRNQIKSPTPTSRVKILKESGRQFKVSLCVFKPIIFSRLFSRTCFIGRRGNAPDKRQDSAEAEGDSTEAGGGGGDSEQTWKYWTKH